MQLVQNEKVNDDKIDTGRVVKFSKRYNLGSRKNVIELPCREITTQEFLDYGYPFATNMDGGIDFDPNKILKYLSLLTDIDEEIYKANFKYVEIIKCAGQIAPYLAVDLGLDLDKPDDEESKKKE